MNPLSDLLLRVSRKDPERHFLIDEHGRSWTYGDLDRHSARLANVLVQRGVNPGDRIAVQTEKSADVIALHVACARVGGVYLPLNLGYTDRELNDLMSDAEPSLLVRDSQLGSTTHATLEELLDEASRAEDTFNDVPRAESDPASMLYTSGTTGKPKGAVMTQANLVFSTETLTEYWGFSANDVLLHILPLFHTHGLFVAVHCVIASGASMILLDAFDPVKVIHYLPQCTVLMGVPTHYVRLLASADFTRDVTSNIRLFTSGSAPMLTTTHAEFNDRTGHTILERYGMTETCMLTSNPLVGQRKPGTVGLPLPGVNVRIVDVDDTGTGSIQVNGPNVFSGYWRRPELQSTEFTEDGWFITGDLGRFDKDGYVEIVGRSKDLVISGGLNVYPKEVEGVLDGFDGIRETAVIGVPDPDFGEAVVAAVILDEGSTLTSDEIRMLARQELAAFKVPKRVFVLEELPRNAMGKVEKARLRQELA